MPGIHNNNIKDMHYINSLVHRVHIVKKLSGAPLCMPPLLRLWLLFWGFALFAGEMSAHKIKRLCAPSAAPPFLLCPKCPNRISRRLFYGVGNVRYSANSLRFLCSMALFYSVGNVGITAAPPLFRVAELAGNSAALPGSLPP